MAITLVGIGSAPNDGTGDTARSAFDKINDNFTDSENAASKLVATTAQANAGTAGVLPDAAGVKSYVDQFGIGDANSPTMGTACGTFGVNGSIPWAPAGGFGAGFQARYAANRRAQLFERSTSELYHRWTISDTVQDSATVWRRVYDDYNIIGIVSQSSGIPTGAIIESGSNANGYYIKYADGTMICRNVITTPSIAISTANSSTGFISDVQTWTYPVAFHINTGGAPTYVATGIHGPAMGNTVSLHSLKYTWASVNSQVADTRYAGLMVIGRWY